MAVTLSESNMAGIGSELDEQLRTEAAAAEEAFQGAGQAEGVEVWRIEKFEPVRVEESEYGVFYSGDSYIVLSSVQGEEDGELIYDLFYWLGKDSTQDELGAAAIYTVNVDDLLGGKPVQHREVQGSESAEFLAHFTSNFVCVDGGVDSGFTHVVPEEYENRLLVVSTVGDSVRCSQVPLAAESLSKASVYILDTGDSLFQWNGTNASPFELAKAGEQVAKIEEVREGEVNAVVIDGDDIIDTPEFWEALGAAPTEIPDEAPAEDREVDSTRKLYSVADSDDGVAVELVAEGDDIARDAITPDNVWLMYMPPKGAAVYAGPEASRSELMYFTYCIDELLQKAGLPPSTPVTTFSKNIPEDKLEAFFA